MNTSKLQHILINKIIQTNKQTYLLITHLMPQETVERYPGWGIDQLIFVKEGLVTVSAQGTTATYTAGDIALATSGIPTTIKNTGTDLATLLILYVKHLNLSFTPSDKEILPHTCKNYAKVGIYG